MPYAVLEKQLKELPEEYLDDVSRYVQLLQYKIAVIGQVKEKKKGIILGLAEGKYKIPDDINAYDDEILRIKEFVVTNKEAILAHARGETDSSEFLEACLRNREGK